MRDNTLDSLLPCPFCGNRAIPHGNGRTCFMECVHCNANGPESQPGHIRDCEGEAIALWNRRAPIATPPTEPGASDRRCEYCDGTGLVHSPDGQYLGHCSCRGFRDESLPTPKAAAVESVEGESNYSVIPNSSAPEPCAGKGEMPCLGCDSLQCADCFQRECVERGYVAKDAELRALAKAWSETERERGFVTQESICAHQMLAILSTPPAAAPVEPVASHWREAIRQLRTEGTKTTDGMRAVRGSIFDELETRVEELAEKEKGRG